MSVAERAALIKARFERLARDRSASPEDFEVVGDSTTGFPFARHKRYQGILFPPALQMQASAAL